MYFFAIPDPADFVTVEVNTKKAILCAHHDSIFVDQASGQRVTVFDNADRVIQDFSASEKNNKIKLKVILGWEAKVLKFQSDLQCTFS